MPLKQLQYMVYASLMAALTAAGAYIHVPLGPVPMVLQNLFVVLAGLLFGARWGFTSVAIYLLAGALGIPVFAGGKGGIAHFMGPTGGYLLGFAAAAFITGTIAERSNERKILEAVAAVIGFLTVYALGVPWLKAVTGMSWEKAVVVGMLPFLPGDMIKAFLAFTLARAIRPVVIRSREPISP